MATVRNRVTVLYQLHTDSGVFDLKRSFTTITPGNAKRLFDIVEQRQGIDILAYKLGKQERLEMRDKRLLDKNRPPDSQI